MLVPSGTVNLPFMNTSAMKLTTVDCVVYSVNHIFVNLAMVEILGVTPLTALIREREREREREIL